MAGKFPYGSPNKTYPNYFVTDKWFGFFSIFVECQRISYVDQTTRNKAMFYPCPSVGFYGVVKAVFADLAFNGEIPTIRLKVFEK